MCTDNYSIQENDIPDHNGTCVNLRFMVEFISQKIRGLRHNDLQEHYHRINDWLQQELQTTVWGVCTNP